MADDLHKAVLDTETLQMFQNDPAKDLITILSTKDAIGRTVFQTLAKSNTDGLIFVSETIPSREFVKLTLEPENFGLNAADQACIEGNHGSLAIILDIFKMEKKLDKLINWRDLTKKNILHQATISGKAECFELLVDCIERKLAEKMIAEKEDKGINVIAMAAGNNKDKAILAAVVKYLGKEKVLKLIDVLDNHNRTALHRAARNNSDNFLLLTKTLPKQKLVELICHLDDLGRNVFHHATVHRDAVGLREAIKLVGKEKAAQLIAQCTTENENVVSQSAANNWTADPLKVVYEVLGKKQFTELLSVKDNIQGLNSGHNTVINNSPDTLTFLTKKLEEKSLVKLLKTVNEDGKSMLDMASRKGERLQIIGDSLNREIFIRMFTEADANGQTVGHRAAYAEPSALAYIFGLMDEAQLEDFVSKKDINGDTLLHIAAREECSEIIKVIHTWLDDGEFLKNIQSLNNKERNVLQEACTSEDIDTLNAIIDSIDLNEVAALASNKDREGQNAFHICAQNGLSEGILTIFELFFDNYEKALALIGDKDESRSTVSHYAAKSDVCLGALLEVIHEEDKVQLFNMRNGQDYTVIQMAAMHANPYTDEIKTYSQQQTNSTTHASNKTIQNSMHQFIELHANAEKDQFNHYVVSLNSEQWRQMFTADALGNTPFHLAAQIVSPENMETLLFNVKYQTKLSKTAADFLFDKNKKGETPITVTRFNPRMLEMWKIFEKHLLDKKIQLDNEIKRAEQKMKKETRKWLPDVKENKFGFKF